MLKFVIRKMLSKKWMVLALLIGNILLVSITAGNPMYSQAMLQRTLTRNLEERIESENVYPGLVKLELKRGSSGNATKDRGVLAACDALSEAFSGAFGLETVARVRYLATMTTGCEVEVYRENVKNTRLCLSTMTDMADHIELVGGRMYSKQPDDQGIIDVILSQAGLDYTHLVVGDVVTLPKYADPAGNPIRLRIAGAFKNRAGDDDYWVNAPSSYVQDCFMDPALFESYFLGGESLEYFIDGKWFTLLDYTAMDARQVEGMLGVARQYADLYNTRSDIKYSDSFTQTLEDYLKIEKKVNVTLWALQAPIFVLLAAFIVMVSRQMLDMERDEIAVLKSRGAGRRQILEIYLVESGMIALIAYGLGLPLGVVLCRVIGSANAFLEFVQRSALKVKINHRAMIYGGIAAVGAVGAMVLPALRYSKTTIVAQKRRKQKKSDAPLWQKLFLDVILLGISLYGLYSFNGQKATLAARVQAGEALDPLLFFSSSLFMLGAGLLAVRLAPLVVWLIFTPFKRRWSPALYASFMRVLRNRSSHGFIMVFLIMTIALGIFNAQAARTINQNVEDNLRYVLGADMVVRQKWKDNASSMESASDARVYTEPDFTRYEALGGYEALTRVYVDEKITVDLNKGNLKNVRLMGIHTREFGQTAYFRDDLLDAHWYNYLNAMSQNSQAILVSSNFKEKYGCKLGDSITYANENGATQRGIIYGFVDYFPSYLPVEYVQGEDGLYSEVEKYLIVAHLQQLQSSWGVSPYEIWFKNRSGGDYLYDFAENSGWRFEKFEDAGAQLVLEKNDPVLQGTNGILTVGFIVVLILCSVGFLIYWILSIQSRALQFGIFRAMGMSMGEVIAMLLNEQLYISGLSIVIGAGVGHMTAKLFMPLIQMAYASSDNALPLRLVSLPGDNVRLFTVVGLVMLVCMVILGGLISRMKIAQALKLGED